MSKKEMAKGLDKAHCLMMPNVFIYALKDPDTGQIRYVGATINLNKRLRGHLCDKSKNHRTNWIRSLGFGGMAPVLIVLDEVPESEWQSWEAAYIAYFYECGCALVNGTPGGDNLGRGENHPFFGKTHSPEYCQRMSVERLGKNNPMFGMPGPMRGKKHSQEARVKIGTTQAGKIVSLETRAKMGLARFGKKPLSNSSGFVGVSWSKSKEKWESYFGFNRKKIKLGRYEKIEDAVFVRALAIDRYFYVV